MVMEKRAPVLSSVAHAQRAAGKLKTKARKGSSGSGGGS